MSPRKLLVLVGLVLIGLFFAGVALWSTGVVSPTVELPATSSQAARAPGAEPTSVRSSSENPSSEAQALRDGERQNVSDALHHGPGTISGRVRAFDGTPIENAHLIVLPKELFDASVRDIELWRGSDDVVREGVPNQGESYSAADGSFRIDGLAAGEYLLMDWQELFFDEPNFPRMLCDANTGYLAITYGATWLDVDFTLDGSDGAKLEAGTEEERRLDVIDRANVVAKILSARLDANPRQPVLHTLQLNDDLRTSFRVRPGHPYGASVEVENHELVEGQAFVVTGVERTRLHLRLGARVDSGRIELRPDPPLATEAQASNSGERTRIEWRLTSAITQTNVAQGVLGAAPSEMERTFDRENGALERIVPPGHYLFEFGTRTLPYPHQGELSQSGPRSPYGLERMPVFVEGGRTTVITVPVHAGGFVDIDLDASDVPELVALVGDASTVRALRLEALHARSWDRRLVRAWVEGPDGARQRLEFIVPTAHADPSEAFAARDLQAPIAVIVPGEPVLGATRLAPGRYTLEVSARGAEDVRVVFDVRSGEATRVPVKLVKR